jgi:hypothetical protein
LGLGLGLGLGLVLDQAVARRQGARLEEGVKAIPRTTYHLLPTTYYLLLAAYCYSNSGHTLRKVKAIPPPMMTLLALGLGLGLG